jgi:hypothetical protein
MVTACSVTPSKPRFAWGHITGGAVGGLFLGCVSAGLAFVLERVSSGWLLETVLPVAGTLLALQVMVGPDPRRFRLSARRQVPQQWSTRLRPAAVGWWYGMLLGLGLATPTPVMMPQLAALTAVASLSPPLCVIAGTMYGVARSLPPVILAVTRVHASTATRFVDRSFQPVRLLSGSLGLAVLATLVVTR